MSEKEASPARGQGKVKPRLPKRFYQTVATKDEGAGASLLLDGKPVRTPAKAQLVLPTRALADAVAQEWRAQGERIDLTTMPLTKLANSAIDGVAGREQAVIDDIMSHAAADLVCYRAAGPPGLVEAQTKHWDKVLAWAADALAAPLKLGEGVVHVAQPRASLDRIRHALAGRDAFSLAALHVMTALTGSALLALAVASGQMTPEETWAAAHVDEDWQIGQWGEDGEAAARRKTRWRDFAAAALMFSLLNPSPFQGEG
ncbi:MAG: ATP12 family chaperone protein [Methyloceanibacter sp.]